MSHPILERHRERRTIKPLYLFFGDEEFLMHRALKRLEQAIRDQSGEDPLKVVMEAQEVELSEFLAQSRVAPLWGPGQILVLRQVETYPAEDLKAILAYRQRPAPRAWVVFWAVGLKAKEVERHPVWGQLQRDEAALGFFRLREGELQQWLAQEARSQGKTLAPAAAQRLVEMVGDNLTELSRELEKLVLYAGTEKTLTPTLVSQLASHSRSFNIFALVEALGDSRPQKVLSALDRLLDLGEPPVRILTMLARQLRLLLRLKDSPPGTTGEALARSLGVPQWTLKKLAQQAKPFSAAGLKAHLFRLHHLDLLMKTSTAMPRLWLEWALLQMGQG